ncbi:hypothetical protein BX661DRAFT_180556 [Kickxella alabastrina]|uniref:uncharacterized protein n=1 Tax=Kickxella alabastrina TaxID=61397 RepID=UPI00221E589B|nr:uncharacterized protein BX661DRAFT_180556 [Kickxella alabastrina]KAI7831055.1 hypothetical protein BX661DRAFT_180556 [Kickxella alabastrina]
MDYLNCINHDHFSPEFSESLSDLLSHGHVLSCIERAVKTNSYCEQTKYCSVAYEVRVNTVEVDGHWYHRCLTESNHHNWNWQKQRIYKNNIFPSAPIDYASAQGKSSLGPIKYLVARRIRAILFNLAYVGWVPNVRAEYYKEIVARQRLAQMELPAVSAYLGCVIENGFIIGVAVARYWCSLERALGGNISCTNMDTRDLVASISTMQKGGLIKAPVLPSSVVLDKYGRLILVSVECIFSADWCGGTKPWAEAMDCIDDHLEMAKRHPLGLVFARICATVRTLGQAKLPTSMRPNTLTRGRRMWDQRQQVQILLTSCNRHVCKHSALKNSIHSTRPQNTHTLWVSESHCSVYNKTNI